MESVTNSIVAAVVSGAVASVKDVATSAVKDAYVALKQMIFQKCEKAAPAVESIEKEPSDEREQAILAKHLYEGGVGADEQLQELATTLLDAIAELRGDANAEPFFDFDEIEIARDLKMTNIESVRQIMRVSKAKVGQDFIVDNIRDGLGEKNFPKK